MGLSACGCGTARPAIPRRLWRAYLARFDIEHAFKFAKATLGLTAARVRTPEQADRWVRIVMAASAAIAAAAAAERPGPLHRFLPSETGRRYVPVFTPTGWHGHHAYPVTHTKGLSSADRGWIAPVRRKEFSWKMKIDVPCDKCRDWSQLG